MSGTPTSMNDEMRRSRPIPPRNPGIDLLRGLSILFVILNHLGLRVR